MKMLNHDLKSILCDHAIHWEDFDSASVLVTGATGLIGSLLVRTFCRLPKIKRVYAHVRDAEKARKMLGAGPELLVGDIREPIDLDADIDYIIHCASVTASRFMVSNPVDTISISVRGTESILEFARKKSVKKVLYLSSMEVYGKTTPEQNPITENQLGYIDLSNPRASYPESKRLCEAMSYAYFSQFKVPIIVARLAQSFGAGIPLSDNRVSMQFAKSVIQNQDIILHTKGLSVSNFCYTTDVITALLLLLIKGCAGETYNISNENETRTIAEIASLVASRVAQDKIKVVFDIPDSNVHGYAADSILRLSSQKLMSLGWIPKVDMIEAYHRLISYLEEEQT